MKRAGKVNLALMELIWMILFFALSSIILVQVFVKARKMSDTSRAATQGLLLAQDLVEQLKPVPQKAQEILKAADGWQEEPSAQGRQSYTAACTEDMRLMGANARAAVEAVGTDTKKTRPETASIQTEAAYEVRVTVSEEPQAAGSLFYIEVTIERRFDQERITELSTACYFPENREVTP